MSIHQHYSQQEQEPKQHETITATKYDNVVGTCIVSDDSSSSSSCPRNDPSLTGTRFGYALGNENPIFDENWHALLEDLRTTCSRTRYRCRPR